MVGEVSQHIVKVLKTYGYKWPPQKPEVGLTIRGLIFISLGRKRLHDSGYPFIQVYGIGKDNILYDLGMHDHIWIRDQHDVNLDSLGANVFRLWLHKTMQVGSTVIPSTLEVDSTREIR